MQAERQAYRAWQSTLAVETVDPGTGRIFCVDESGDESGIAIGERVRYGYAKRGQPCVDFAPYRKGRRTNMVGFVCSDGSASVTAIEGHAVCRVLFSEVMRGELVPRLRRGDVVVWDNHTIHKDAVLLAQIASTGARVVWLPRYSPDLNPAEWLWSHIKRKVRRACADSSGTLREVLGVAVEGVEARHVVGWLRHGGFPVQLQPV